MELQHLNLKIFAEESSKDIPLDAYIPIFHSWIQSQNQRQRRVEGEALRSPIDSFSLAQGPEPVEGLPVEGATQAPVIEMVLDVADYAHVPQGPGVMLIGHHANISMDETEGRLGLLYNRKVKEEGSDEEKIQRILKWAFAHAKRLQAESVLDGKLKFKPGSLQWMVNDRLLAPHNEENAQILERALKKVLEIFYGKVPMKFSRHPDLRERLTLDVEVTGNFGIEDILQKL